MAKRFPKILYVRRAGEGREPYFVADEDRDALSEKGRRERVAVYELKEIQELETVTVCRSTSKS